MRIKTAVLFVLILALVAFPGVGDGSAESSKPDVIRIGYVESEEYPAYSEGLLGIGNALTELGLISGFDMSADETDSKIIWQALAASDAERLRFVPDMYFNMKELNEDNYSEFINNDSVDLVLVMGTAAGVYFTEHEERNDYMVLASANPIGASIVPNETERYKANSYAYLDMNRYSRQLEVAYNTFHIEKIGVVYENNPNTYAYSGIDQLNRFAERHRSDIVTLHVDESKGEWDDDRYYTQLKDAYRRLAHEVDAIYITTATTEDSMLPWLLEDVHSKGVATISQVGESQVRAGVVLGVTLDDPKDQGRFLARQLERYLDGVPVNMLEQVYEITPKFFINYDAALSCGLKIPIQTLLMADEIFRTKE